MTYLTDGAHLYEIVGEQNVQNYGLVGGRWHHTIVRDCRSENVRIIDDLEAAICQPVNAPPR